MRRALFAFLCLASAGPAAAQGYDRYGAAPPASPAPMVLAQQQGRVLTWNGKSTTPQTAPQSAPAQAPQAYPQYAQAYPQPQAYPPQQPAYPPQAYPQQQAYAPAAPVYPQAAYPQGAYPPPAYPAAYPQTARPQGAPPAAYGQPGQPQQGVVIYPSISTGAYSPVQGGDPRRPNARYGNTRWGAPSYANQPAPPPAYPPEAYQQQVMGYPQPQMAPPPGWSYPPAQAYQVQVPQQPAQPQYAPAPAMAAPTTPVTGQPLPTSIYAPAPRAENAAPEAPKAQAQQPTAVAALDARYAQGPRHYSVHRAFGIEPDKAPAPAADNRVLMAAPIESDAMADPGLVGFRGVGPDDEEMAPPAKTKKAKKADD